MTTAVKRVGLWERFPWDHVCLRDLRSILGSCVCVSMASKLVCLYVSMLPALTREHARAMSDLRPSIKPCPWAQNFFALQLMRWIRGVALSVGLPWLCYSCGCMSVKYGWWRMALQTQPSTRCDDGGGGCNLILPLIGGTQAWVGKWRMNWKGHQLHNGPVPCFKTTCLRILGVF